MVACTQCIVAMSVAYCSTSGFLLGWTTKTVTSMMLDGNIGACLHGGHRQRLMEGNKTVYLKKHLSREGHSWSCP